MAKSSKGEVFLCKSHYNEAYKCVNRVPCAVCQAYPKCGKYFNRHSPDAETISSIFGIGLTCDDVLCLICYKAHLTLLSEIEHEADTLENRLAGDIEKWLFIQQSVTHLNKSILEAVIFVARHLKQNKALLLSSASIIFTESYAGSKVTSNSSAINLNLETDDSTTKFTSLWLLNNLIIHLNAYLEFKCVHRRFGTMLYNILTSLSWALGASIVTHEGNSTDCSGPSRLSKEKLLHQSAQLINDMLHKEIKRISEMPDLSYTSLTGLINNTDTRLITFLKLATQSVKERRASQCIEPLESSNLSKIATLVCLLITCTNAKQLTPIHNILADIIETCGGSRELIRILNRMGFVSSPDSHDRFVTFHAEAERDKHLWTKISPSVVTVASVDNFDMLQTHSAIYQGKHHRSYHGTTIQLVQPLPSMTLDQLNVTMHASTSVSLPEDTHVHIDDSPHCVPRCRRITSSPLSSPHKLGKGPKRRCTIPFLQQSTETHSQPSPNDRSPYAHLTIEHFKLSLQEKNEVSHLDMEVFKYMFHKRAASKLNIYLPSIRQFLKNKTDITYESSTIHYLNIISENADSDSTLLKVSEDLIDAFQGGTQQDWILLAGDGKTYQHITKIKNTYGESLKKLLVFPGDWHTLKNFQETIMKVYFRAGLKEIAEASGYKGTTLVSLEKCSNFKRTHAFIVQLWEAMYRAMLMKFANSESDEKLLQDVVAILQDAVNSLDQLTFMSSLNDVLSRDTFETFHAFIESQSSEDEIWRFWNNFLFVDCEAYIYLFLSIRGCNWDLRNASLKKMVPTFAAFDRDVYQRLIPNHIADCHLYPSEVLDFLKADGFTVQIRGDKWKAVALDEAHEMCINKDLKAAITYPTESYLQKTSLFLNTRIESQKKILQDLFLERNDNVTESSTLVDNSASNKGVEDNIMAMMKVISDKKLFQHSPGRILSNPFSCQEASNEQRHDLLSFCKIGEEATQQYINHHLIKQSSSSTTVHRKKLLTMSSQAPKRKRKTNKEKESEVVIRSLPTRLAWCKRNNQAFSFDDDVYSVFPRALCDENGTPHKSSKSHWNDKLKHRYASANPPVFSNSITSEFVPQVVIIDAMFLINTKPLRNTKTVSQYTKLLFARFLQEHFNCGVSEIHLVFDKPERAEFNPKQFEQERRDGIATNHTHKTFESDCNLDKPWQEILKCRTCKYSLVKSIGQCLLKKSRFWLIGNQLIILSGCFSGDEDNLAWIITSHNIGLPQPEPNYHTDSEEADLRIWRHVTKCDGQNILIYTHQTQTYQLLDYSY